MVVKETKAGPEPWRIRIGFLIGGLFVTMCGFFRPHLGFGEGEGVLSTKGVGVVTGGGVVHNRGGCPQRGWVGCALEGGFLPPLSLRPMVWGGGGAMWGMHNPKLLSCQPFFGAVGSYMCTVRGHSQARLCGGCVRGFGYIMHAECACVEWRSKFLWTTKISVFRIVQLTMNHTTARLSCQWDACWAMLRWWGVVPHWGDWHMGQGTRDGHEGTENTKKAFWD